MYSLDFIFKVSNSLIIQAEKIFKNNQSNNAINVFTND